MSASVLNTMNQLRAANSLSMYPNGAISRVPPGGYR